MKTKHFIIIALVVLSAFLSGLFMGKNRIETPPDIVTEIKETTVDTISHLAPKLQSEMMSGIHCYPLHAYCIRGASGKMRQCVESNNSDEDMDSVTVKYGIVPGGESQGCTDSAIVELPLIQRHYADSTYEAWVSGPIDPRLDSVKVFASTTIISKKGWKPPKRWHIGPTIGYGYTPNGFQPYFGVSLTYSILSW